MTIDEMIADLTDIRDEYGNVEVMISDRDESPLPWRGCVVGYEEEYKIALIS